jgi:mono/diheme cytochrome c family protein
MWFSKTRIFIAAALALSLAALSSCTKKPADPNAPPEPLADKGKRVYMANCVACHSSTPGKDGPIGPALAGSSRELLLKRVVEGVYPQGYKPKRDTKVMAPLPHLKNDIEALEAFLAAP